MASSKVIATVFLVLLFVDLCFAARPLKSVSGKGGGGGGGSRGGGGSSGGSGLGSGSGYGSG
ncbi:hypothetical protein ACSBR1_007404 [Camellia fascicularis]